MDRINPILTSTKDDEEYAKHLAFRKREWLSMLLETGNKKVVEAYEKYDRLHTENADNSGIMPESEVISSMRPLTINEISMMSNRQIAEHLNNYKKTSLIGLSFLEVRGLVDTLTKCVAANPQRFINNLSPFQEVHNLYQSSLLQGFLEAWRDKKEFDWAALLEFIHRILSSEIFWIEQYETGFNYRNWVFSTAADLIEAGTKKDEHAFDAQLLPLAEEILLILAEKTQPNVSKLNDLLNDVLNSVRGKVFSAMVNYALRFARTHESERQACRWPQAIKADFTKRLERRIEPSFEFSYTLGLYLPYLAYLDEKWVIDNINRIFPLADKDNWHAAFSGYLLQEAHRPLYHLLKAHGHYRRALHTHFADEEDLDNLVSHICTGWIEGCENLNDKSSLIYQLIHSSNLDLLAGVAYFFYRQIGNLSDKVKTKVVPAWRALFSVLSQHSDVEAGQKVLTSLLGWLELIDKIDVEVLGWVKESIKHIGKSPGYGFTLLDALKALRKHVSITPLAVGEIYLEIPQRVIKDLQVEADSIKETLRILYNEGHKDAADKICARFVENGSAFLRPIYEEFQD